MAKDVKFAGLGIRVEGAAVASPRHDGIND